MLLCWVLLWCAPLAHVSESIVMFTMHPRGVYFEGEKAAATLEPEFTTCTQTFKLGMIFSVCDLCFIGRDF
jgi:hypothetical protein